jgi:hypothetical protein
MLSLKNHSLSRSPGRRVRCTAAVSLGYCEPSKPQSDAPGYSRDPGIYRLGLAVLAGCYSLLFRRHIGKKARNSAINAGVRCFSGAYHQKQRQLRSGGELR